MPHHSPVTPLDRPFLTQLGHYERIFLAEHGDTASGSLADVLPVVGSTSVFSELHGILP